MYNCILFIGTGQIGKAILKELVKQTPKKIIIHNLTQKESEQLLEEYSPLYPEIEFISSYGNIFLPYELKDVENNQLHKHSETIINYFYNEITGDILSKSTIYSLVKEHKPDLIVDAINSATVLGNAYDPEYRKEHYSQNPTECCQSIMVDDFITKIINFVSSLKYSIEQFDVKKYVKVSTTGIGGMGMNMPYTHGDNPKINLSLAIMGKISASGVLHQLLWNLSHTNGMNISLIIPGTFVGYDSLKLEAIETDKGLLKKRNISPQTKIEFGQELKYNYNVSDEYLQFPVIRAGENHVYSIAELNVLTAIGQMEAITKEEVARATVDCILGNNDKNIFSSMDNAMLSPTYSGREMICDINKKFKKLNSVVQGVATGNLGVTTSKLLYELYLIKKTCPTIKELKLISINKLVTKINNILDNEMISEIITLGIPVLTNKNEFYVGDYSLIPNQKESKVITEQNLEKWTKIGWVDLRKENIQHWQKKLMEVFEDATNCYEINTEYITKNYKNISDDYDIAEYLAYYNNLKNKGRKK